MTVLDGYHHVGFTGTRRGLTAAQARGLRLIYEGFALARQDVTLHHGDCVGADAEAGVIFYAHGLPNWRVETHPGNIEDLRAHSASNLEHPPKPTLERNLDIVEAARRSDGHPGVVLACPREPEEVVRSGTWATVRRARKHGRTVLLILPDGSVEREEP